MTSHCEIHHRRFWATGFSNFAHLSAEISACERSIGSSCGLSLGTETDWLWASSMLGINLPDFLTPLTSKITKTTHHNSTSTRALLLFSVDLLPCTFQKYLSGIGSTLPITFLPPSVSCTHQTLFYHRHDCATTQRSSPLPELCQNHSWSSDLLKSEHLCQPWGPANWGSNHYKF